MIGARQPLVAFNVYLTTSELGIAKKVAAALRHSSGGLRYVKALGLLVDGRAQVSMNLTNYRGSPIHRVVEMIRREAQRYGVGIHHSELVGLVPQEALVDSAVWYTQLDQFEPEQILEKRLYAALQEAEAGPETRPEAAPESGTFLDALAAGSAAPGGGSAAAFAGAAAAALVAMVARLTVGKKKYAAVEDQMQAVIIEAENLRAALTTGVEKDAASYTAVMEAFKLPKETAQQQTARSAAIQQATLAAIQPPLETARQAVRVLELAQLVIREGNLNAISDGGSAAALCRAALTGAGLNVRINANSLAERQPAEPLLADLAALEDRFGQLETQISQTLKGRAGLA